MKSTLSILIILIATLIILLVVLVSLTSNRMKKMISRERQEIINAVKVDDSYVTEAAIRDLPFPVYKWMQKNGIIGKPVINSAYVKQKALMKMKVGEKEWKMAEATKDKLMKQLEELKKENSTLKGKMESQGELLQKIEEKKATINALVSRPDAYIKGKPKEVKEVVQVVEKDNIPFKIELY